ncbi:MAG: hypothetical protein IT286_05555 [Proteobacteria bacterium]|nr:hypothetical protein [Pseudomonadota bacterium]
MSKETDIEKLKADLEVLTKDVKKIIGSFRETLREEVDNKKEQLKDHLEDHFNEIKSKIPSSKELQDSVTKHAKSTWMQYLAVAFVAGIVVSTLFKKDDK